MSNVNAQRQVMTFVKLEDVLAIVEKNAEGMSWSENPHESGAGFELLKRAQALRSLPTDDGWEDIATASKDEMILGHADGMVRLVMWQGGRWVQVGATIEPGWFEPTEWKPLGPLPAPPSD